MSGTRRRGRRRLKSLTERLLQDGHVVDEPTAGERAELARLENELELITVSWRKFFLCIDHNDDADLAYAWNRTCDQKLEVDTFGDEDDRRQREDDLRYECPQCGRVHWPTRRRRTLYDRAVISMPDSRVQAFFEAIVLDIDPAAQRLDGVPAYRLQVDGREAYACLIDLCTETRFATKNFATTNPIAYVTAAPRVFTNRHPEGQEWLQPLPLHELAQGGSAALKEKLIRRMENRGKSVAAEALARAYLPGRRPEPRVHTRRVGIHDMVISAKVISLDGVEVLFSKAKMQMAVVSALADQHLADLRSQRAADQYRWMRAKALLKRLGDTTKTDEAEAAAKYVGRARNEMAKRYEEETGIHVDPADIIQSSSKGYRLNPTQMSIRYA